MEWSGEAIVLGTRKHGETSVILEVMTPERGRHMGLVRGGRSRKQQPTLQPGNEVSLHWRARLAEQLGQFTVEPLRSRAASLMESAVGVRGVQHLASLVRLLPERDPHPALYNALTVVLDHMDTPAVAAALTARFELEMLSELGFGLDLSKCAATGVTRGLVWVSPRSGRAVSLEAGQPYADKLLPLPGFLTHVEGANQPPSADMDDLRDAFRLTGYFLNRHIYEPRGLPPSATREGFLSACGRTVSDAQ